jgi:hypothetical protein
MKIIKHSPAYVIEIRVAAKRLSVYREVHIKFIERPQRSHLGDCPFTGGPAGAEIYDDP